MTILNGKPIKDPAPTPPPVVSPVVPASAPVGAAPVPDFIGMVMGLVSIFLGFVFPPAGIVVGAIGLSQSRRIGRKNPAALIGLILSIVFTVLILAAIVLSVIWGIGLFGQLFQICEQLGEVSGEYKGNPFTCS
jgi:hypothetical protein